MSLLDTLEPELRPWAQALFEVAQLAGVNPRVTSGRRSFAQQEKLYRDFQEGRSRYPAAPPGRSAHEYGLAFDMVVNGAQNQVDCGIVWNSWGGDYGGEEDPIHFQYPGFTPPPGPPAAPTTSVQIVPSYTPGKVLVKARQLADILYPLIGAEIGYIFDIDAIANAIAFAVGSDAPAALAEIRFGLEHPEEFFGTFRDAMVSTLLSHL